MAGNVIRWGILGPGAIASGFAEGLTQLEGSRLVAVGSRSTERAVEFAERFGASRAHGSYDDLVADPEVDVVYVATPHSRHARDSLLALEAGKHVLCEKPFTVNATEARLVAAAARARGLFAMEAMWSRFLPAYRLLSELLAEGRIGDPLMVEADFGFLSEIDPTHRHFDPLQAGGGLLDLGVYPVQLASLVLGTPDRVAAEGHLGETGVDEQVAAVLHHPGGRLAVVKAAVRMPMTCTARIAGTGGWIDLPAFMHCPGSLTLRTPAGTEEIDTTWTGQGLRFQVEEVERCLAAGLTESPRMSLDETISIAATLDAIRAEIGLVYPMEAP